MKKWIAHYDNAVLRQWYNAVFGIMIFILIFLLNGQKYLWFCGSSRIFLQSLQVHSVSDTWLVTSGMWKSIQMPSGAPVFFHRVTPQEWVFLSPILNHIWKHLYITSFKTWKGNSDCSLASCRSKFDLFMSIFNLNIYTAKINPECFYSVLWKFGILALYFPWFSFLFLMTWSSWGYSIWICCLVVNSPLAASH